MAKLVGMHHSVEIWCIECTGEVEATRHIRTNSEAEHYSSDHLQVLKKQAFDELVACVWEMGYGHVEDLHHALLNIGEFLKKHLKLNFKLTEQNEEPYYQLECDNFTEKNVILTCNMKTSEFTTKCGPDECRCWDNEDPSSYVGIFFGILKVTDPKLAELQHYLWMLLLNEVERIPYTFDIRCDGKKLHLEEFRGFGSNESKIIINRHDASDFQLIYEHTTKFVGQDDHLGVKAFIDQIRSRVSDEDYFNSLVPDDMEYSDDDRLNRSDLSLSGSESD